MITVYASIGNSDDKLAQHQWRQFVTRFMHVIEVYSRTVHGQWYSAPDSAFQNACCCFEILEPNVSRLRDEFGILCTEFGQDAIAWAVVAETEMVR